MRSQNTFYFFITDSIGRSAYWENGIVKWQTTPRPLEFSPDGWRDTMPTFTRSSKYYGINRQFTTPYKFVEDGAYILRYLLYTGKSYETNLYLNLNKWNHLTDIYEPYFKGQIDLVKEGDAAATGITCNIIEGGFLKLLDANDETEFEIPLDGTYTKYVQLDGIELHNSQPFSVIPLNTDISDQGFIAFLNHFIPLIALTGDGAPTYLSFGQPNYGDQPANIYESADWIVEVSDAAKKPIDIHIKGTFTITLLEQPNVGHATYFLLYHITTPNYNVDVNNTMPGTWSLGTTILQVGETNTLDIDFIVTLNPGERLYITGRAFADVPGNGLLSKWSFSETIITLFSDITFETTVIKAISPYDLCNELLKKVTNNGPFTLVSSLLQQYSHLVLTSGDGIRGLDNAVIKTSFSEFFESFNKILFAGFGFSGLNAIFESRNYFYNSATNTISLGEVSNLQTSLAENELVNKVKVGYPNQNYTDVNGRSEFNTTFKFQLPVVNAGKKELDLVSTYRADPYGIEFTRINFEQKTTTDSDSDNSTFILNTIEKPETFTTNISYVGVPEYKFTLVGLAGDIASFGVDDAFIISNSNLADISKPIFETIFTVLSATVNGSDLDIVINERPDAALASFAADISFPLQLRREVYTSITGVLTNSVFNIEDLTPKRMLLKHAPYLRALLYFFTLERITFLTSDKNKELSTVLNGITITEKASVRVDTLGDPLFYPYIFTFKTRVPYTFMSLFKSAVNGHVQFSYNGFTLYGFPVNMSVKPGFNEAQEWKLLASPLCNLPDLVDLLANPLNNVNMATYGLSFSMLCPVQMVPQGVIEQDVYNHKHMDLWTFEEQSTRYTDYHPYGQKWQLSDNIHLQCISRNLGPVQVDVINRYGRVFGTYSLSQIITPAVASPYQLFQGDINLSVSGLNPGCYRLRCTAGIGDTTVVFLSEWLNIAEIWPNTLLFEYTNTRNQAATIFSVGYHPSYRIEGNIIDFIPRARFSSYEDEPANQYLLEGVAYRQFTLFAGDSFGLPPWAIDKLNRIMTLNTVTIDGKQFVRNEDAQFESVNRVNGLPGTWWRMEIREAFNLDNTSMTTDSRANERVVLINVDSAEFGDLTDQTQVSSNPVQIEILNQ